MYCTPEKVSNSMIVAKELSENEAKSLAALREAKKLEKQLLKEGKLVKIQTVNGVIFTTDPSKYEEYHKPFKNKKI